MDKMRDEFQKWFYDQTGLQCKFDSYDNAFVIKSSGSTGDTIVNTSCCIAWQSWQASRAALCVELPKPWFDENKYEVYDSDEVKQSLSDIGVPYK